MLSEFAKSSSWWDDNQQEESQKKVIVDVSKVVTAETIEKNEESSLLTVNTKDNPNDIQLPGLSKAILTKPVPPPDIARETGTVASALTLDDVASRMDNVANWMNVYEGNVNSMQTEVAAIHDSMNKNQLLLQAICAKLELNGAANTNRVSGDRP